MKFNSDTKAQLINCAKNNDLYIEGNILKLIDVSDDKELEEYVKTAIFKNNEFRKKRLEITKKVQDQNIELIKWKTENEKINEELKTALEAAEKSKESVLNDLDVLQKKTQYQLIETIVKIALWVIVGVGIITTGLFVLSLLLSLDNKIIESAWSNMFGILLTNSFSIIGTIMGVKYASDRKKCNCDERE